LWNGVSDIGTDLYSSTGTRQFDGAIDEVAVYNYTLSQAQINNLFTVATGIPIPAVIQVPPTGQTNFVNLGQTVAYTTVAANGSPTLYYHWYLTNLSSHTSNLLTDGANGYGGSLFSGTTNATLTISNMPSALAGMGLMVSVSNTVAPNLPAQAAVTLPMVFPTPVIWTADFDLTNGGAWDGYPANTGYQGYGTIGLGTSWNAINGAMFVTARAGVLTNNSSHDDTGLVTNTGTQLYVTEANVYASFAPYNSTLFDPFLVMPTSGTNSIIVSNAVPGFYNLFILSLNGSWGWRGTTFTINGTNVQSANNGLTPEVIDNVFLLNQNYVIFTNILTLTGNFNIGTSPSLTAPLGGVNTASEADFNGMQVQFIAPFTDLAVQQTGTNAVITWSGGTLVSSPSINGPYTPVNSGNATSPYHVPGTPGGTALFYRMQVTGPVPGVPVLFGN